MWHNIEDITYRTTYNLQHRWDTDLPYLTKDFNSLHSRGQSFIAHLKEDDSQAVDVHFLENKK